MDPFLTTYKRIYVPKHAERRLPNGVPQEFKDPVSQSFKKYLQLSSEKTAPIPPTEDADMYLKKYEPDHPKISKMYFTTPINNEVMGKTFIYDGRTVYQVDYCDLEKDEQYKEEQRKKNMFRLPNDVDIPLSTHKYCYRNPLVINSRAMEKVKITKPRNNLDPDEPIREILKVTTGKSEYGAAIGDLGEIIMKEELHGKIVHAPCTCLEHHPVSKETNE